MKLNLRKFGNAARSATECFENSIIRTIPAEWQSMDVWVAVIGRRILLDTQKYFAEVDEHLENAEVFEGFFGCKYPFASQIANLRQHTGRAVERLKDALDDFDQTQHQNFMWVLRGAPGKGQEIAQAYLQVLKYREQTSNHVVADKNFLKGLSAGVKAHEQEQGAVDEPPMTRELLQKVMGSFPVTTPEIK